LQTQLAIDIDVPADTVWRILAHRYCDVAEWADLVERSWPMTPEEVPSGVQVAATAPVPGRWVVTRLGELAEVLVDWSEDDRMFQFVAYGVPPFVTRSANRTTVVSVDKGRCRVTLDLEMVLWGPLKVMDPVLAKRIGWVLGPFMADLKRTAETDAL
jgi:hypothetical protein